eukprot:XP_011433309.1 PREDICTED: C-type lectin domain family 6 member A [Crassostrea gigas]
MKNYLCLAILLVSVFDMVIARQYCQKYVIKKHAFKSWKNAKKECERIGMHLVKVNHGAEDGFLRTFLRRENPGFLADGWYIGGKYSQGSWRWLDESPMTYQNFPGGKRFSWNAQDVTNYAFIMQGTYQWGYVSPFGTQKLGYICESTKC